MASKEVKNALKAARDAIRNKEFKEALKQCKVALAEDKNNYNALVFIGVAAEGLEQYEQALKAYRRASEVAPEQLLAWQGLSTMYSKNPDQIPREEMVGVFEKLIELHENDKEKQQDATLKLLPLIADSNLDKKLSLFDKLQSSTDGADSKDIVQKLVSLLEKQAQLTPDQEAKLLTSLHEFLSLVNKEAPEDSLEKRVMNYLHLVQKREPERLYEECSKLVLRFPALSYPLETKLRLLLDRQMDNPQSEEIEEIRKLASSLAALTDKEKSAALMLAEGYLALLAGKLAAARDSLQQGLSQMSTCFCGHLYLAQALFKLHANSACLQACEQALKLQSSKTRVVSVSTVRSVQRLHTMAARCCLLQGTRSALSRAVDHLNEVKDSLEEAVILLANAYLELGEQEQLQECLAKLGGNQGIDVQALQAWVDFHNQDYTSASSKLQQCVAVDSTNADYLLKLGRTLWARRNEGGSLQEECFNALLKAAKLDPYLSGAFLYLGHFYAELKKDQQRAKKCYQKAYDLDPDSEEAGAALCDMMLAIGEESSVQNLLQKVTQSASAGYAKWAWLRLGLAQVRTGDPSSAAVSFQSALRADPDDRHVWECLAEAYLQRGSFTAALKAFGKAVELHPDSTYCLYQMASIKQRLGILTEAVDEYKIILDKSADYVPALKGIGETYLMLAHRYLSQFLLGLAKDTCQQSIAYLTRAATQRPDLSCVWKLLGDCCIALHPLHSASFRISVSKRLCQATSKDNTETAEISKEALLEVGTKCYGRALKILPDSSSLWHDLGVAFFYLCKEKSSDADRKTLLEKSVQALKKSLNLDPTNHVHWTALGVVAANMKNPSLAQHCFIKSVQNETNNAVAWTNLGTLYLQHDNIELAHEAFKVAQSQEPEYMSSWIGQALIAESVGHEEAMDLFRHTTELGIHMESCVGYGHWVISTLLDVRRQDTEAFQYCIKQMSAIPAAVDALTRYTVVRKDDPLALNMLGLLLEHQSFNKSALEAFRKAASFADEFGIGSDEKTKIQLNLARLLRKNGQTAEAVGMYKQFASDASFGDLCQWGLALYEAGQYDDSYQVYAKAFLQVESDADGSDVCTAMGIAAYRAGKVGDAKDALFQGFQVQCPSVQGLLALCVLGLLQGDGDLAQATLQELTNRVKSGAGLADLAILTAASKQQQGEDKEAVKCVQELLKERSDDYQLHLLLSRMALQHGDSYGAENSALSALDTGGTTVQGGLLLLSLSQMSTGRLSRRQPAHNAIRTAQKAFHTWPDDTATLCCLIAAVYGEAVLRYVIKGDSSLFSQELKLLNVALTSGRVTAAQKCWCLKQKAVSQIFVQEFAGAKETLQQMVTEFPQEAELVSVLQHLVVQPKSTLDELVIRDGTQFLFWQILLSRLIKEKQWAEARLLLKEALQKAKNNSGRVVQVVCLVTIGWLAVQQLVTVSSYHGDGEGDSAGVVRELEEAGQVLEQVSEQPYCAMQVLQALAHLDSNDRKAKHHFANALNEGNLASCLGVDVSLARRGVITLLHRSAKDQELVQQLLSQAESSGDVATVELYQRLYKP